MKTVPPSAPPPQRLHVNDSNIPEIHPSNVREGRRYDVVIVGGGQAGLAAAYWLRDTHLRFIVLEQHGRLGMSWLSRYDSLRLFSPRRFSALPGALLPGDPEGFATKDEVADYLAAYAARFHLPVSLNEGVSSLTQEKDGFRVVTTCDRTLSARAVIICTGPFQRARVPEFSSRLSPEVFQLTADRYRRPNSVPAGRVLVVGAGATGRQIADELARVREVSLAIGRRSLATPARILGRHTMWWGWHLGILTADKRSVPGRMLRSRDSFPCWHLRLAALQRNGVQIFPRAVNAIGREVRFANDQSLSVDAVIWACGYRDSAPWLQIPAAIDEQGCLMEDRGRSPVPGLFHLGRAWQNSQASALLCGIGRDAAAVVQKVSGYLSTQADARRMPTRFRSDSVINSG